MLLKWFHIVNSTLSIDFSHFDESLCQALCYEMLFKNTFAIVDFTGGRMLMLRPAAGVGSVCLF